MELTGRGAVALVADLPQAVQALVDATQLVLQLAVLAVQGVALDLAQVGRVDDVVISLCGSEAQGLVRASQASWGPELPLAGGAV